PTARVRSASARSRGAGSGTLSGDILDCRQNVSSGATNRDELPVEQHDRAPALATGRVSPGNQGFLFPTTRSSDSVLSCESCFSSIWVSIPMRCNADLMTSACAGACSRSLIRSTMPVLGLPPMPCESVFAVSNPALSTISQIFSAYSDISASGELKMMCTFPFGDVLVALINALLCSGVIVRHRCLALWRAESLWPRTRMTTATTTPVQRAIEASSEIVSCVFHHDHI